MPHPFETEEERAARAIREQRMSPMMSQTAIDYETAGQDFAPREAQLAQQMRMAQGMMQSKAPQGRMAGNVYVAPSWAESLANTVRQGTGAYAAYKTGKGRQEVAADRKEAAASQGRLDKAKREADLKQEALVNQRAGSALDLQTDTQQFRETEAGLKRTRQVARDEIEDNKDETARLRQIERDAVEDQQFQDQLEVSRQRAMKSGKSSRKPGVKLQADYLSTIGLSEQMDQAQAALANFTPEQMAMADQPGAEVGLAWMSAFLPEGTSRIVEENAVYTDADVRDYRNRTAKVESDFSKLASGLAVTGFEMKDRKKWSPFAEGVSRDDRKTRMGNLQEITSRQRKNYELMYPDWTLPEGVENLSPAAKDPSNTTVEFDIDDPNLTDEEIDEELRRRGLL